METSDYLHVFHSILRNPVDSPTNSLNVLFLQQVSQTIVKSSSRSQRVAGARAPNIAERKVTALQHFIKSNIEHQIFNPLIQQAGLNPKKANIRLNWGNEKPETKLEDLIRLAEISATSETPYVKPEEVRKNLIKAGFELWENNQ
jgi:hypothetical protein